MLCMIGSICLCDVDWNQVDGEFYVGGQEVGAREEELWRLDLKKDLKFKASIVWDLLAFNHDHMTYLVYKQQTLKMTYSNMKTCL